MYPDNLADRWPWHETCYLKISDRARRVIRWQIWVEKTFCGVSSVCPFVFERNNFVHTIGLVGQTMRDLWRLRRNVECWSAGTGTFPETSQQLCGAGRWCRAAVIWRLWCSRLIDRFPNYCLGPGPCLETRTRFPVATNLLASLNLPVSCLAPDSKSNPLEVQREVTEWSFPRVPGLTSQEWPLKLRFENTLDLPRQRKRKRQRNGENERKRER